MSLNLNNQSKSSGGERVVQETIEHGVYPARVVRIIDLGLQPGMEWQGQQKPNQHKVDVTYELLDVFMKDKDGNENEDKPRWISEDFGVHHPSQDKAKSTIRVKAIDPNNEANFDLSKLIGMPCMVTIGSKVSKGKTYNRVLDVAAMRPKDAAKAPELKNEGRVFMLDEPDLEYFNSLPEWMQDRIKGNLEFKGSALDKALSGKEEKNTDVARDEEAVQEEIEDGEW